MCDVDFVRTTSAVRVVAAAGGAVRAARRFVVFNRARRILPSNRPPYPPAPHRPARGAGRRAGRLLAETVKIVE